MNKKVFIVFGGMLLYSFILVFGWRAYSLVRFDGVYSPMYVYGLSNPFEYYQKHIGSLLLKYGKEYKLKPTIDENNPETYNVYRDEEHNFEFKYQKGFYVKVNNTFFGDTGTIIEVFKNGDNLKKNQCTIDVLYKGWGVGRDWLPKRRSCVKWMIANNKKLRYFYAKNGQIVHTTNCGMPNLKLFEDRSALVDYIDKNSNRMYYVTIGGKKCSDKVMVDVLTTFQFIK